LQLAENLAGLTAAEQQKLEDPDLKTNPYTRFFDLSGVKDYMGISFNANGDVSIAPPRKDFDAKLKLVVKAFLNDDTFDTRTDPDEVLGPNFKKAKKALRPTPKPPPQSAPPSGSSPPTPLPAGGGPSIKPDRFFESLACRVTDNSIAAVVGEIKKVGYLGRARSNDLRLLENGEGAARGSD
jgi:hypothetical protein